MGILVAGPALDVVDRCIYFISTKDGAYTINRYNYISDQYTTLAKQTDVDQVDQSMWGIISMAFDGVGRKLYWANERGKTGTFLYSFNVKESDAVPVQVSDNTICENVILAPDGTQHAAKPCNQDKRLGVFTSVHGRCGAICSCVSQHNGVTISTK